MVRMLTEFDVKMFYIMESMKSLSKCIDKQVVCLLVDGDEIVSVGVNTVHQCDKNCDDKANRTCLVTHAEKAAVHNLRGQGVADLVAYVSLFPCAPCQAVLDPFVKEIVTFGMAHKDWVSDKIRVFPHPMYKALKRRKEAGYFADPVETCKAVANRTYGLYEANVFAHFDNREHYYDLSKRLFENFGSLYPSGVIAYTKSTYV